jgi:hypothetical protein
VVTEKDWTSYARAVIDFTPPGRTPFRLVPDAPGDTGVWPQDLVPPVLIVTAWNPDSVILPLADNQARNHLLVAELDRPGVILWPAVGRDPDTDHYEDGVAISGLTPTEGVILGLRHGQAAIFVWDPAGITVVSCSDERHYSSGWRLTHIPSNTVGRTSA